MLVLVAGCLGLRASEVVGLQRQDIDGDSPTVRIRRGVVHGREGDAKTEAAEEPIPLDPDLAAEILRYKNGTTYVRKPGDKPGDRSLVILVFLPAASSDDPGWGSGIEGKGWRCLVRDR
jgi:integrase